MAVPDAREYTEKLITFGVERLTEHLVELAVIWVGTRNLAPNALELDRQERIMRFIADYEDGLLDEMALVAPKALVRYVDEFRRDIRAAVPELVEQPAPATSNQPVALSALFS